MFVDWTKDVVAEMQRQYPNVPLDEDDSLSIAMLTLCLVSAKIKSPAIIVELKYGHNPDYALRQIRDRQYFEGLSRYHGDLLFVGITY